MSESSKTKTQTKTKAKAKGKRPEAKGQDGQLSCLNAAAKVRNGSVRSPPNLF